MCRKNLNNNPCFDNLTLTDTKINIENAFIKKKLNTVKFKNRTQMK